MQRRFPEAPAERIARARAFASIARCLVFLVKLLPKVGPLSVLAFRLPGEYRRVDQTYVTLCEHLARQAPAGVPVAVRLEIERFFGLTSSPSPTPCEGRRAA